MARGRPVSDPSSPTVPVLLAVLLTVLQLPEVSAQQVVARGFHPDSPPDMVASGSVIETLSVAGPGECAARALYRNALGFNLQRAPGPDGKRSCQPTNVITGCFSVNLVERAGWDYYQVGRQGQGQRVPHRSYGHTLTAYVSAPASYPAEVSADPDYRWGLDCNGPTTVAERQCSRYILTGIQNAETTVNDLDYVRCYMYGTEFRVSQEVAAVVPVELDADTTQRLCPPNHVVTALADPDSAWFTTTDFMKCNLLMANWRVNYDNCFTQDPRSSGAGRTGWSDNWNIDTPYNLVYGVVGIWRSGLLFTGFKACRMYRVA
ncbi:uncharacterized protein LOC122391739 [Amphibalanus amphitrite]|uniref:uncharacterized protein LOC122374073 n=1 Tax=Amphibalanus amphitrite TaxID=1232801 RepID=UPI001C91D36D|nr:uncharacterized protein LOC122374073 [Amphibalanus amphitrite]XP_043241893.1 uncharacterized protein LOC122391739 [Amphibalanus amphitrite]